MPVPDEVVLIDSVGHPIGRLDRESAHHDQTPRHLGFSLYLFNDRGALLLTRRALTKRSWPGVWTNTCCGHPRPGEDPAEAVRRRLDDELGLAVIELECVLPDFSYTARDASGVVEDELCPTFVGRLDTSGPEPTVPRPNPDEVAEWAWAPTANVVTAAAATPFAFSPWSVAQLRLLGRHLDTTSTSTTGRATVAR